MNCAGKLKSLKAILNIASDDSSMDDALTVYLEMTRDEIINWMYINYADKPEDAELPQKYDIVQIQAVVAGCKGNPLVRLFRTQVLCYDVCAGRQPGNNCLRFAVCGNCFHISWISSSKYCN